MRFIIQRVRNASVKVDNQITGEINQGFLVFIGVHKDDNIMIADKMIRKLLGMRIFSDENDKINLSLSDVNGQLLLVSQFTLYADCKKGNRPSFTDAARPELATELFDYIISECKKQNYDVQTGIFGADMKVSLLNDGPFTIILDSDDL